VINQEAMFLQLPGQKVYLMVKVNKPALLVLLTILMVLASLAVAIPPSIYGMIENLLLLKTMSIKAVLFALLDTKMEKFTQVVKMETSVLWMLILTQ
jgi:hypothetical protein